jgi:carboxymethylenebutenolidase
VHPIIDRAPQLAGPLLGLFGNEDKFPSPEHVDQIEAALTEAGKDFEFHRYDGAGHSFFSVDRPAYRVEAAVDGWEHIERFLDRHLGR